MGLLAAAVVAAVSLVAQPGILFGRVPPPPALIVAEAGQVSVVDGSTLRLRDRVLRLDRMTAPTRGTGCAAAQDCAGTAARTLAALVRDRQVECRPDGHDDAGRPYAACRAGGLDLSTAMVSAGWGWSTDATLHGAENAARAERAGMWASVR